MLLTFQQAYVMSWSFAFEFARFSRICEAWNVIRTVYQTYQSSVLDVVQLNA